MGFSIVLYACLLATIYGSETMELMLSVERRIHVVHLYYLFLKYRTSFSSYGGL